MGGILGIVYFDGRPADRGHLALMARAASHRALDGEDVWTDGSSALVHQHSRITPESLTEEQPLLRHGLVACVDGRIDNRQEIADACVLPQRQEDGGVLSDPEMVVAAFRRFDDRCADRLRGDFAFVVYDTACCRVLLARDVMGARPLFYAALPGGIAFASDMKALLAHPGVRRQPDQDGLADLVLNGHYDGWRTWFEDIRSVPPGAALGAGRDGITISQVSHPPVEEIRHASPADYVEHFAMLFDQAVRRRLRSAHPVALSVSGGVDSSSIYCAAARVADRAPLKALTLAYPAGSGADERDYVDLLRAAGLAVEEIPIDAVRLITNPEGGVSCTDMPRLSWDSEHLLLTRAREAGCRVLLEGFCGDQVLAGHAYLLDLARARGPVHARRHAREHAGWMDEGSAGAIAWQLAGAAVRRAAPSWLMAGAKRTVGRVRARRRYPRWFSAAFRERAHARATDRVVRQRRFGSAHREQIWTAATSGYYLASVLQTGNTGAARQVEVAYPFRDRDLVAFLAAVPGEVVCAGGVPKALLRQAMAGIVPEGIRMRRSKADGTALSNRAAQMVGHAAVRALGPESCAARAGWLDPDTFRALAPAIFESELTGRRDALLGWQVGDTLALELWAQWFCGDHAARG